MDHFIYCTFVWKIKLVNFGRWCSFVYICVCVMALWILLHCIALYGIVLWCLQKVILFILIKLHIELFKGRASLLLISLLQSSDWPVVWLHNHLWATYYYWWAAESWKETTNEKHFGCKLDFIYHGWILTNTKVQHTVLLWHNKVKCLHQHLL